MKKTNKLLALLLVVVMCLAMVLTVAACTDPNKPDPDKPDPDKPSTEKTTYTIKVWVSEKAGVKELTEAQIAEYNASQDSVIINAEVTGVTEANSATDMISDVESGADIFCFAQDQIARLVQAGALAQPGVQATETITNSNDAGAVRAATIGERVMAYPLTSDNGYFMMYDKRYINEDHLDSLEQLIADCEAAGRNFAMELDTSAWYLASFFFATGCHSEFTYTADGENIESVDDNWNSDNGVIAMKGIQKLEHSSNYISASKAEQFAAAIPAAILVSGTWELADAIEAIGAENLGFTDLPSFTVDGTSYHMGSFCGNKLMGVKPQSDAKKAKAMSDLALYLSGKKCQLDRFEKFGWGPSNKEAQEDPKVKADASLSALALQNNYATPQGQYPSDWWNIAKVLGTAAKEAAIDDAAALRAALVDYESNIETLANRVVGTDWTVIGNIYGDNDWTVDHEMKEMPAGTWTTTKPLYMVEGQEFKVRQGKTWDTNTGAVSDEPGNCVTAEGGNCKVTVAGWYFVKFDAATKKISLVDASVGVVGSINNWGATDDVAMTKVDGDELAFEAEITVEKAEEIKIRFAQSWDYGDYGDNGGNYKIEAAGTYIVKLTFDTEAKDWVMTVTAKA